MGLDRWDPFREMMTLRDAMDRLFQQSFVNPGQLIGAVRNEFPVDLIDQGNTFLVKASLPGVRPEDLEITVQGDQLTIRAEMRGEQESSGQQWLMREHRSGVWQRTVSLPTVV